MQALLVVRRSTAENKGVLSCLLELKGCSKAQGYLKKDSGHRMEGLLWPGLKPVYDSVVDQAREVAATCAQGLSNRRHCQHHMQVVAALQHKL